jgi:3-deoxy-D-arabino-heptulosonate 7-phosphate (DAHP) synthase class II
LAAFRAGDEAHHAFRQSIVNDLEAHCGYSAARAEQVVDLYERLARRRRA